MMWWCSGDEHDHDRQFQTLPWGQAPFDGRQFSRCVSRGWKAEDTKTRSWHQLMCCDVNEGVPDGRSASEKNECIRTISNPPKQWAWIRTKEHHLTRLWPWRSKREQKNEGRDKWNWRERWNCESLWFSVSIELKHGQQRAVYLADVWFTNSWTRMTSRVSRSWRVTRYDMRHQIWQSHEIAVLKETLVSLCISMHVRL